MEKWVKAFSEKMKHLRIGDIEFAGPTYQMEIHDRDDVYWPFLQFHMKGGLKDAFCSCDSEEEKCAHIALAYTKIYEHAEPLHLRYRRSLWYTLFWRIGDHAGFAPPILQPDGSYHFHEEIDFVIRGTDPRLAALFQERPKETPENSIKFSSIPTEEIEWWKEGRPSAKLRYRLSCWADFARLFFLYQDENPPSITFDKGELPLKMHVQWEALEASIAYTKEDLIAIIPLLETVPSPLKVVKEPSGDVDTIHFDRASGTLKVHHQSVETEVNSALGVSIDGWIYQADVGFIAKEGSGLLSRETIPHSEVGFALENDEVRSKLDGVNIYDGEHPVEYAMHFDEDWTWHFSAYLFEEGDIEGFFGQWAYVKRKGFYRLIPPLFSEIKVQLQPDDVAGFVNHHRVWLNGQEGFQTHLASIESQLTYSFDSEGKLCFAAHAVTQEGDRGSCDFGEWIYYSGQGFFSKQHARLGQVVRPGVVLKPHQISSFIKVNREELEGLPHFFTDHQPIEERGLEVIVQSPSSIVIRPVYRLFPSDQDLSVSFYGDFVYIKNEGFCALPLASRLPKPYCEELVLSGSSLNRFLHDDYPKLQHQILYLDPKLQRPHKYDVEVSYLVRSQMGGLKTKLFFESEHGKINVLEILEAFEKKRRYLFSGSGLIDLTDPHFQWIRGVKRTSEEGGTLDVSTLEFLRLDATLGLRAPREEMGQAEVTRRLIKELREFTVTEKPQLKGLRSDLRLYQQTGLNWLWFLYKNGLSALLCDDMGLGKTHQSMALMAAILNLAEGKGARFLVVCPTSVIYHWQDKLETFLPSMKVHTFHGLKRTLKGFSKGVLLTTYGIVRLEQEALKSMHFELAVFDEVQTVKNPQSRIHEALLKTNAKMKVGLTGTPIENNLRELKSLFDVVLPGYMPSEKQFRDQFINPIEKQFDEEKKALLTQMIRPFILRRRKTEVLSELPEKSEDKSYCHLSDVQEQLYTETLDQNRDELIADLRDREAQVSYVHIFSLLSRLKQVCDHPALVHKDPSAYTTYPSGKWDLFVELIEEAHESEQKVVVFSQYLYMLDIMEHYLKEKGRSYAQIRGDTVNRKEELKRFQEDPKCTVFIGSLQAAGLGIDLTAASIVILYDRWWNAARENQAIDRVHRMGQKRGVQVYKLITKGTIEEKIDQMIIRKGQLMEEIVTTDDQGVLKQFSRQELIDLLSYTAEEK